MKKICGGWLRVDAKHPELFGEVILLSDYDGTGFALGLGEFQGKYVRVTVELVEPQPVRGVEQSET